MLGMALVTFAVELPSDYTNPILTGVPSLTITPDAIAGGMGDVGTATSPNVNSQYWNSSKYIFAESQAGASLSYTPWLRSLGINDINLANLVGYYQLSPTLGTISASLRYFSLGDVSLRQNIDETAITVNPFEMSFDAGYSRRLSENFSMGVVLRFIASDLSAKTDDNYYTGYAFSADVNGYYSLPIDMDAGESHFGLGFNLSNIGTKISYDKGETSNFLPTQLRLGASYLLPFDDYNRIEIAADASKLLVPSRKSKYADDTSTDSLMMSSEQYSSISSMRGIFMSFNDAPYGFAEEIREINWSIGLEYAYNEQFFARTGYYNEDRTKGNRKYFTIGAGFKMSAFRLDVGYVISVAQTNPLDQTLRFSLAFDLDGLKDLAK